MLRVAAILWGVTALSLGATAPAQAQRQDRDDAAYQEAVRSAVAAFDIGDWASAQRDFERAHALQPSARTLRGLGMCAFERSAFVDAFDLLTRALEDERRPLTDAQRADVAALLDRTEASLGHFTLAVDPADAEISVDGVVRAEGPGEALRLPLGHHVIEARMEGYGRETREIEVGGGERVEISLRLQPTPDDAPRPLPIETIGYGIAGGSALLVDFFFIGWAIDRQSTYDGCASQPGCTALGPLGDERDASAAAAVFFGLSALGLGATAFLYWLLDDLAAEDATSDRCRAEGLGLACRFSL